LGLGYDDDRVEDDHSQSSSAESRVHTENGPGEIQAGVLKNILRAC